MRTAGYIVMMVLSLGVAGYGIVAYGFLPPGALVHPGMRPTFESLRDVLYAHIFGSAVALALGPFQFSAGLRARRVALHRLMGRLYLGVGVLIGGLAGLFMATQAFGGPITRGGFVCLALIWLYTGFRAYRAIRIGDTVSHRRWMVLNFSLTFAAVTLRLWLPVLAMAGMAGFLLWAFNEAGQQTLTMFAFDRWRLAWEGADEAARAALRVNAVMYDGIWDGMYMLLLIGFAIGNACLGAALSNGAGFTRVVGGFLLAACALTMLLFLNELGVRLMPATALDRVYPLVQPLGRALVGVWLWRCAGALERS